MIFLIKHKYSQTNNCLITFYKGSCSKPNKQEKQEEFHLYLCLFLTFGDIIRFLCLLRI